MHHHIISLSGAIGSGKDTAADYLVRFHDYHRMSFASSLKDCLAAIFGWDRELLEGHSGASRAWREQVDAWWADRLNIPEFTPRWAMQHIGTEVMRNSFHNDIWVASIENRISKYHRVVVTDARFANEISTLKKHGSKTVRIVRGEQPAWQTLAKTNFELFRSLYPQIHASEYSSVLLEHDYYIDNNGSIEELYQKIDQIVPV